MGRFFDKYQNMFYAFRYIAQAMMIQFAHLNLNQG